MSKGSAARPLSVTQQEYFDQYDAIFGKPKPNPPEFPAVPAGQQPPVDSIGERSKLPYDQRKHKREGV